MNGKQISLSQFFGLNDISDRQVASFANSKMFQPLKQNMADASRGVALPENFYHDVFQVILDKLAELLEIDLLRGVFIPAWKTHPDLQEYCDPDKHPPGETAIVPLVEHSVTTSHLPTLEPSLAGRSLGELEFEVEGEFLVKGAILEVRDAKIVKVRLGDIKGTGTLGLAGVSFLQKEGDVDLIGSFDLAEGIPIIDPATTSAEAVEESIVDWGL